MGGQLTSVMPLYCTTATSSPVLMQDENKLIVQTQQTFSVAMKHSRLSYIYI